MLGRLAKWLRLLGYDTLYSPRIEDREILRIARADNRILLTRNTRLLKIRGLQNIVDSGKQHMSPRDSEYGIKYFFVNQNNCFGQLKEIISAFNLKNFSIMSRCAICNSAIENISKNEVKDHIPEYTYRTSDVFRLRKDLLERHPSGKIQRETGRDTADDLRCFCFKQTVERLVDKLFNLC